MKDLLYYTINNNEALTGFVIGCGMGLFVGICVGLQIARMCIEYGKDLDLND